MRIISGKFRNLTLRAGDNFRPSSDRVRETLFNMLQNEIQASIFVDGFSGSGAVGIEALSRGATKVYFLENNRRALQILESNLIQCCENEKWRIYALPVMKAMEILAKEETAVDFLFFDPPYDYEHYTDLLEESNRLFPAATVIIEASIRKKIAVPGAFKFIKDRKIGETILLFFRRAMV